MWIDRRGTVVREAYNLFYAVVRRQTEANGKNAKNGMAKIEKKRSNSNQ